MAWRTLATAAVALTARRVRERWGRDRVGRRERELSVGFIEDMEGEERAAGEGRETPAVSSWSLMCQFHGGRTWEGSNGGV
jgi:hypothetical protein